MRTLLKTTLALGALAAFTAPASASLVYDSSILASAQGFGTAPRDLTLQSSGNNTTESGSVSVGAGGGIVFGISVSDASVFMGNGITNANGVGDLPQPLADDQKYGTPTIGSLGITSASQIAILFNATEPSGNAANVTDLTLKFYTADGTLLGAIDGQQNFSDPPGTNPGNGVAGFTFVVDQFQQAYVNGLIAQGGASTTLALEATITDVAGGPESFLIYNRGTMTPPPPRNVPEPASMALLGTGLFGLGLLRRKRA